MSVEKRDPHTGYLTTGHEWNGIKELNTPVPRAVYFFLILGFIFAVACWLLLPAWPLGVSYTKGILGVDQRSSVSDALDRAKLKRSVWAKRLETESYTDILADKSLMKVVRQSGHALFGDNCAACHGTTAQGIKGFPNLTTSAWLWGGDPQSIAETIRVGVNSSHPDSRSSQMLAFGRDDMLSRDEIENVVEYVSSLSSAPAAEVPKDVKAGKEIFANNCASCHGDKGQGSTELGAPNLTDDIWIYGGDARSILTTVWDGRQGHMPTWEQRLSVLERRILTLYLADLRMAQ